MKTIALTGPYNPNTRTALYQNVPQGFRMIDVPDREHYHLLKEANYIIIRTIKLEGSDLENVSNLRLVQKWGAGYDTIDVPGISELDIPVAICTGVNSSPVAEMAVMHMLALYRNFIALNTKLRHNIWAKDEYSSKSYILEGKMVGIVGLGNIGRKVARIVQGFGAKVIYHDTSPLDAEQERTLNVTHLPFEELLASSDIVSLHLPLMDTTRNLIDSRVLSLMKPTAILINTSRGGIVDETALLEALRNGVIAGAGLDAFSKEPPDANYPFFELENVTLTPHTGGNTADNDINMIHRCMGNISKIDHGQCLSTRDVVNNHLLKTKLELEK
jgi:phosphoglycerate dehydrogenase-like enzyme